MHIVIAGGTGFIGRTVAIWLTTGGHRVTVLTRNPERYRSRLPDAIALTAWDGEDPQTVQSILDGVQVVINLCGESIAAQRWTATRKQVLLRNRLVPTRCLVEAMGHLSESGVCPGTFISASGVGYYGPTDDVVDEHAPPGRGFLADLCRRWEDEAVRAETYGIRTIRLRIGMVLGRDGGALPQMLLPFRLFLGGPLGSGKQFVSWIHQDDLARLMEWIGETPAVRGPVNAVAPHPVTMQEFSALLGQVLNRPSWLRIPEALLKLGLGELATVMTTGQRVRPTVALDHGFRFEYPDLLSALRSLLADSGS
ncbi:MAG: TIGR01777 family protein [Nitrospirae bacterium]|nr:MAG: TIGR01777 family protein [Nitrospirota bacterium]